MPDRDDDIDGDRPRRRRDEDGDFDRPRRPSGGAGIGVGVIIAIVAGVVLLLGCGVAAVLIGLLLPAVEKVRQAAGRQASQNNLKEVALAVLNYNDRHNRFPPAAIMEPNNPNGRRLLSWRVAILPYMQQDQLYRQFKLDEPWDSPANRPLIQAMPKAFQSPTDPQPGRTHYRVFVGSPRPDRPRALFEWDQSRSVGMAGVTDGTANTLMIVEAAEAVEWTRPDDFDFDPDGPLPQLGLPGATTFNAVLADGSIRVYRKDLSPADLKALITRNGGEIPPME